MISSAVKSVADMLASLFNWRATATEQKALTEVVGDKRDLERACRWAEFAIMLVERKANFVDLRSRTRFERLVRKFRSCRWK